MTSNEDQDLQIQLKEAMMEEEPCQLDCLLNLIELMWEEEFQIGKIILWLEIAISISVQDQYLHGKRTFRQFLIPLKKVMKEMKEVKLNAKSEITFDNFKALLKEKDLFTMFCQTLLPTKMKDTLRDVYLKNIQEESSSGFGTKTTRTLSTTVPTAEDIVDVLDWQDSLTKEVRDELSGMTPLISNISSISQNISWNHPEGFCTLVSPGEKGSHLIKLELYELKNLRQLPRNQWWKEATIRMNFLASTPVDPLYMQVNEVIKLAVDRIKGIKNLKKEVKKKNYWNSSVNIRQAPY